LVLDELAGLSRVEHTELKSALSTESDTYRRAYRKDPETFPRMFVLAGTTNEATFLTDPTGNRRYWPVTASRVNVAKLETERDQLWAEAVALYRQGFDFWHLPPEAEDEAQQRQDDARIPDDTAEVVDLTLARAYAETTEARPPVIQYHGAPFYFVGSLVLMSAVAGEDHAYAKNTGLSKRVRNAMLLRKDWTPAKVYVPGTNIQRRGYIMSCKEADEAPRARFDTSWEAEFGQGSKF
jgi:hypothetical protein